MAQPLDPRANGLLRALPDADWARWEPHLERVGMSLGQVMSSTSPAGR